MYGSIYYSFRFLPISDDNRSLEVGLRMAQANANEKLRLSRGISDALGGSCWSPQPCLNSTVSSNYCSNENLPGHGCHRRGQVLHLRPRG